MSDEILYKVDCDAKLRIKKVVLGHGSYVNIKDLATGETETMVNRATLGKTPRAAWSNFLEENHQALLAAKRMALKALRYRAVLTRTRTAYSGKEAEERSAEQNLNAWITSIIQLQDRSARAVQQIRKEIDA